MNKLEIFIIIAVAVCTGLLIYDAVKEILATREVKRLQDERDAKGPGGFASGTSLA